MDKIIMILLVDPKKSEVPHQEILNDHTEKIKNVYIILIIHHSLS